jgi:alpha-galactosidase
MVNPDSDLYRAHPEWVLGANAGPQILARNQLVLNLALEEVQNYLYDAIDALLSAHPINYLKWDMNRELHQAADQLGRASVHRQTLSLYALLARLRQSHPNIEIESCASGGGRADYGILQYTDRIWTSDNNDALDRLHIQKGFSMFFPADIMGSHVGPRECHITGRVGPMSLRSGVALFGHMGMEMNVLELEPSEKTELKAAIALHKRLRPLVHSGDLVRLDTPRYAHSFGIVDQQKEEALFSYTLIDKHVSTLPAPLRFSGLDANAFYSLTLIWPEVVRTETPSILNELEDLCVSGEALMYHGLQMPLIKPENLMLFHLQRVELSETEISL